MKSSECNLDEALNDKSRYHNKSSDEPSSSGDIKIIFEQQSSFLQEIQL